jgi:glycosyltransferase involved in cell wall biosynthesis
MPAYNAEKTLAKSYEQLPHGIVDRVIIGDDCSHDDTVAIAKNLRAELFVHEKNLGYGGNQKTCYREALKCKEDIIIMVHPDYQYSPRLVTAMAAMIASGEYDVVLASRILGKGAVRGGMPLYKYYSNRVLTLIENLLLNNKISEYHTGYRAYHRRVLEQLPLEENSDDFVFDNQMLAQIIVWKYRIGEISCPTRYFPEASSINFRRSCKYGLGVLWTAFQGFLALNGLRTARFLSKEGRTLSSSKHTLVKTQEVDYASS